MKTSLGDNLDLDGGVTTRVVNRASVDLGDGHSVELVTGQAWTIGEEEQVVAERNLKDGGGWNGKY